jgi:uncharacterized membrane protein YhaH (DUF805 family)
MPPNLRQVLFSTQGRISRSQLWLKGFLPLIAFCALGICIVIVGLASGTPSMPTAAKAFLLTYWILYLVMAWPLTTVLVKRIHDRNKSGWLVLAYWAPVLFQTAIDFRSDLIRAYVIAMTGDFTVGQDSSVFSDITDLIEIVVGLWFLIEFGCMRGTVGANPYGPDPVTT